MATETRIFGIRHHGPGSARALRRALGEFAPDLILLEGPPDAEEALGFAIQNFAAMKPPVALLVWDTETPRRAAWYPLAQFSPEWQVIGHAAEHAVPVRFMDLPQRHQFQDKPEDKEPAPEATGEPSADGGPQPPGASAEPPAVDAIRSPDSNEETEEPDGEAKRHALLRHDPLRLAAEAAGYSDSERWWSHTFEERLGGEGVFEAVLELMRSLREEADRAHPPEERELQREAWMRRTLREALAEEKFARIAVVCGAWHAPVLTLPLPPAARDQALLRGLPKARTGAAWAPWSHQRLATSTGYGAGVRAPGYYAHLWENPDGGDARAGASWLTRVARLLRDADLEAPAASTPEAVRLADALAALRGRPAAGLEEWDDAALAVFCHGMDAPMHLIRERLVVGSVLGAVPEGAPAVPLQGDFQRERRRLRLPQEAVERDLDLDLRQGNDLARSHLLHRLLLLDVPWGKRGRDAGRGTFREAWQIRWDPVFEVELIAASAWGATVADAAAARVRSDLEKAASPADVAKALEKTLLADLPAAVAAGVERLREVAALANDLGDLMDALPPLLAVLRYGHARAFDRDALDGAARGLAARVSAGLGQACASLDDEAAETMFGRIVRTHEGLAALDDAPLRASWNAALAGIADQGSVHGLVAGRAVRLLLDDERLTPEEAGTRFQAALSRGNDPAAASAWIEGFLRGSGLGLLHHPALWAMLDAWVRELPEDRFTEALPLLRRTFATFPAPERRQMGERAARGAASSVPSSDGTTDSAQPDGLPVDPAGADLATPLVRMLLSLPPLSP